MWRVNSVRSSSLIVCVEWPDCTWILPPLAPTLALEPWLGFTGVVPPPAPAWARVGPVCMRCWAGDESRSLEMSC